MDYKFPTLKEFKNRKCFKCKRIINIGDFLVRNKSINEMKLIHLWENEIIEFFCCLCYDEFIRNQKLKNLKESLSEKEKDIIKILELKFSIKIPILSNIEYNSIGAIVESRKIIALSLCNCINIFPEEIVELSNLRKLNLSWNYLQSIPSSINKLSSLEELNLIGNKLTSIPDEIGYLTSLEELDLSYNKLKTIPEKVVELPNLKMLNLIHNNIVYLPRSVKNQESKDFKILL